MGGVESHCEELLPRIAALDPDVELEVLARRPYMSSETGKVGRVRVTALASPKGRSTEALASTLVGILHARRTGADLVHIHAIGPGLAAPLARLAGMRVVFTHHGEDYHRDKWGRAAKLMLRLGERVALIFANEVIAVSPSLAVRLKARFPRQATKVRHIPNGAPSLSAQGDPEVILNKLGVRPKRYVLCVARLVPEKGLHLLVDAFSRSDDPRKLLMVGGADHGSAYASGLLAQASDRIIFAGVQPRSTIAHLYEHADLFVLPSSHEGLPIAALEAGVSGCAMLLSDIQPNLDLGLSRHHYFRSGDAAGLQAALARSSDTYAVDPEHFRSRFDWKKIAAETRRVYRAVAGR
ncbi:glycosyltransferase family 4 protein [Sphingomonas sp. URHD0057]|uniref:glycosyltransferase family 4 protein n=1 Tax=Sphingomonas sp. URHD0057 TaxID=1380389 RepID=UPI0006846984|nr:glycosyltransferase family 4 protein [Sphingomonas sp. URHD0057]